jgi:acyl carrier protein
VSAVLQTLLKVFKDQHWEDAQPDKTFDELGLDSLDVVELMLGVEESLDIPAGVLDDAITPLTTQGTLREAAAAVEASLKKAGHGPGGTGGANDRRRSQDAGA